jgi:hypothetical protein
MDCLRKATMVPPGAPVSAYVRLGRALAAVSDRLQRWIGWLLGLMVVSMGLGPLAWRFGGFDSPVATVVSLWLVTLMGGVIGLELARSMIRAALRRDVALPPTCQPEGEPYDDPFSQA